MTTAEMVARVRSILDEVSTTNPFYSATEVYSALDAGQRQLIQHLVMVWTSRNKINGEELFETLKPLLDTQYEVAGATSSSFTLPTDFYKDIFVKAGPIATGLLPCRKRNYDPKKNFKEANAYLKADGINSKFYSIESPTAIVFDTNLTVTTHAWSMDYLKVPSAIAVGVEPTLTDGHEEICQYACYLLFAKDRQMDLAVQCYNAYAQGLSNLYF